MHHVATRVVGLGGGAVKTVRDKRAKVVELRRLRMRHPLRRHRADRELQHHALPGASILRQVGQIRAVETERIRRGIAGPRVVAVDAVPVKLPTKLVAVTVPPK